MLSKTDHRGSTKETIWARCNQAITGRCSKCYASPALRNLLPKNSERRTVDIEVDHNEKLQMRQRKYSTNRDKENPARLCRLLDTTATPDANSSQASQLKVTALGSSGRPSGPMPFALNLFCM